MRRNDIVFDDDDNLFSGEPGLWAVVLLGILHDLNRPVDSREYQRAWQIVEKPKTGCLPIIADALNVEVADLQKRILK